MSFYIFIALLLASGLHSYLWSRGQRRKVAEEWFQACLKFVRSNKQ